MVSGYEQNHSEQWNMSAKGVNNTELHVPSYKLRSSKSFRRMFVKYSDTSTLGRNATFVKGLT